MLRHLAELLEANASSTPRCCIAELGGHAIKVRHKKHQKESWKKLISHPSARLSGWGPAEWLNALHIANMKDVQKITFRQRQLKRATNYTSLWTVLCHTLWISWSNFLKSHFFQRLYFAYFFYELCSNPSLHALLEPSVQRGAWAEPVAAVGLPTIWGDHASKPVFVLFAYGNPQFVWVIFAWWSHARIVGLAVLGKVLHAWAWEA